MSHAIAEIAADVVQAKARVAPHTYRTPLLASRHDGSSLSFKAEQFQVTGSFKPRGAVSKLTTIGRGKDIITSSSGNHGIATAYAAALTGHKLTVVLPTIVSQAKLAKIRGFGVDVILEGEDAGAAEVVALRLAAERGLTYVSPYNDRHVIAGQGTIALELLEQTERIDNIFISMGGGGLISGIGAALKAFNPQTRIYGVSALSSMALAASMKAGKMVETKHLDTLADGIAGGLEDGSITVALANAVVDQVLVCDEEAIAAGVAALALNENLLVEGAAGLAMAGFQQMAPEIAGQRSVVLLCGGNFSPQRIVPLIANAAGY